MTTQWYKVIRPNGQIHYATKHNECYFLNGSGFGYTNLDAVSILPMDGCPPTDESIVYVCFDADSKNSFKAIVDKHNRWNGWERPFIHVDDAFRMMKYITRDGDWVTYTIDGEDIIVKEPDYDEYTRIEPVTKNGEKYYYFGDMGWVFEKARFQYEDL